MNFTPEETRHLEISRGKKGYTPSEEIQPFVDLLTLEYGVDGQSAAAAIHRHAENQHRVVTPAIVREAVRLFASARRQMDALRKPAQTNHLLADGAVTMPHDPRIQFSLLGSNDDGIVTVHGNPESLAHFIKPDMKSGIVAHV